MAPISRFIAFVRRYWKPIVGIAVAFFGLIGYYLIERGIRSVVGGVNGGTDRSRQQLRDNQAAIDSASEQQRRNEAAIGSADEQLKRNQSAIEKFDAAILALRSVRNRNGN